jgi:transposase
MRPLTLAQRTHIITLLDAGTSGHQIHHLTGLGIGTISRLRSQYRSEVAKSSGGRPSKLTPANIGYAKRIICMGKADNAVQVTKALQDVTNQSISSQTVRCNLKRFGLRPVVKKK